MKDPIHFSSKALEAFQSGDAASALSWFTQAQVAYPELKWHFQFSMDALKQRLGLKKFKASYEAIIKKTPPNRPNELPVDLVLSPLRGVANDYSFIEDKVATYWAHHVSFTQKVSIIIPVYNRFLELDFVLAGLTHQTYPLELIEVVIADDGSRADVRNVYQKYQSYFPIIHARQEDNGYRLSEVRNLGIRQASHDSIIILDGDAIPCSRLVEDYMRVLHVERNVALFGLRHYVSVEGVDVIDFIKKSDLVYSAKRIISENVQASKLSDGRFSVDWREDVLRATNGAKTEPLPYRFLIGANCGFSRELVDKVGGYCEEFQAWGFEDQEFAYRLFLEGAYFMPLLDAYVYHQEPLSGKNDTDRKLGRAKTQDIFIQKCPFIYRKRSVASGPFERPLVSIYVPLYNRGKYIAECIQSALEQTVKDLEVVVCDDGSTDDSVAVMERFFKNDPRVRLIRKENGGIGSSSNVAVRAAKGCYIGQLDADDVLKKDAVERCLALMDKEPQLSLVYGTTEYIDSSSNYVSLGWNFPIFSREYLLTKMIVHHFRFFRKRDFNRTSGFDEKIKNAVDYDMMLKLSEVGEVRHINRILYEYRQHTEMTTVMDAELQRKNNYRVINSALTRCGLQQWRAEVDDSIGAKGRRPVNFVKIVSGKTIL